jgi:hypothetical protein
MVRSAAYQKSAPLFCEGETSTSRQPTFFLVDLLLDVEVDAQDEHIGDNVEGSYTHEDLWIIERYLF